MWVGKGPRCPIIEAMSLWAAGLVNDESMNATQLEAIVMEAVARTSGPRTRGRSDRVQA